MEPQKLKLAQIDSDIESIDDSSYICSPSSDFSLKRPQKRQRTIKEIRSNIFSSSAPQAKEMSENSQISNNSLMSQHSDHSKFQISINDTNKVFSST